MPPVHVQSLAKPLETRPIFNCRLDTSLFPCYIFTQIRIHPPPPTDQCCSCQPAMQIFFLGGGGVLGVISLVLDGNKGKGRNEN